MTGETSVALGRRFNISEAGIAAWHNRIAKNLRRIAILRGGSIESEGKYLIFEMRLLCPFPRQIMETYRFRIVFINYFNYLCNLWRMSVSVCVGLWLIIRVICEICGFNAYLVAALPR
jgi:hypothetical protein